MMYRAAINGSGFSRGLVGNQYKKTGPSPPPSARHESKEEEEKPRPCSPEHSRATASQLRAMDDFIEIPSQERWKELVNTFRRHSRRRRRSRSRSHHCSNSAVESPFERELKEKMKDRKNTHKYYQHERDYGSAHSADDGAKHNTPGVSERPSKNAERERLRGKSIMSVTSQERQEEEVDGKYRMRDEYLAEEDKKRIAVDMTARTHRSEDERDDTSATEVPCENERAIVCTPVKSVEEIEPSPDDRNAQVQMMQAMPWMAREDVISDLNTTSKVVCLDDVFESLLRFKEKSGNLLVPVSHPLVACFIDKLSPPSQHEMEVLAQGNEGECHNHRSEDGSQRLISPTNAKVTTMGTSHSNNAIISSNEEKMMTTPLLLPQMVIACLEGNDDDIYRAPTSENTFFTKSMKLILGLNILLRMLYGVSMSALVFVQIVCETYAPRRFHHWQE